MLKNVLKFLDRYVGRSQRSHVDAAYYRATYEDISRFRVDPHAHYMTVGWKEGRNPSAKFHTLWYRDRYLEGAEVNPLSHYIAIGRKQKFDPTPTSASAFIDVQRKLVAPLMDISFYVQQTAGFLEDPIGHYLSVGWREALTPAAHFDPNLYVAEQAFIKSMEVSPFYHFASQKRFSNSAKIQVRTERYQRITPEEVRRIIEPEFDRAYYLKANADVRRAKLDPLAHYMEHGWREGRNPCLLFDVAYYGEKNPESSIDDIDPFYHYLTEGRVRGLKANPIGTHPYPALKAPSPEKWHRCSPRSSIANGDYVVIIPVYKGYEETLASIYSVLSARTCVGFTLHVINDRSPDTALASKLEEMAAQGLFSYSCNSVNLGFVKSINVGLRLFPDHDVVLLNADATVFDDWLDRLARHVRSDMNIATITPLSNNATICSYPLFNRNNLIEPECSAAELDGLAAVCNAGRASDIPTGVGFCFFMSRVSRAAIGLFDEASFGRGYGEENDFCLRAAKAGFRNILAEDIFVYHAGEISFAEFAAEEYEPGQAALSEKHPDYIQLIKKFQIADPGEYSRIRLDLYRMARALPNAVIMVSHALSGGIYTHILELEADLRREDTPVIHIRCGVLNRWDLDIRSNAPNAPSCPNIRPIPFNQIKALLSEFLIWLQPRGIHVHSLVGLDWTASEGLLDLIKASGTPYFFTLHDYSIRCHRNDLVKTDGRYCGLPDIEVCEACVLGDRTYPEAIPPRRRIQCYADFLAGATTIYAPSKDIVSRLRSAGYSFPVEVRPHAAIPGPVKRTPRSARDTKITQFVTLGAIGTHKGSQVILNLARDAITRALPIRFTIIGYSDASEELAAVGVMESGRYASNEEAFKLVEDIAPDFIFLPSIWPETFCYTLSMAFALDIPPIVFDLGAQAERVREHEVGYVLPYGLIRDTIRLNDELLALANRISEQRCDNEVSG